MRAEGLRKKRGFWLGGAALLLCGACTVQTALPATATLLPALPPTEWAATNTPAAPEPTLTEPAAEIKLLPPPEASGVVIAYIKEGNLWLSQAGEASQLSSSGRVYSPRISPDGQQIAYLRQVDDYHLELWAIELDGSNQRRLVSIEDMDQIGATSRSQGSTAIQPHHFAWAPGGQVIAFNSQQVFAGPSPVPLDDLNLVDVDSGVLTFALLAGWGGEFVFSPDGSQAAIATPTQIILTNPDGSNYRAVFNYEPVNSYSESRFYARPAWAADGSHLLAAIPPTDPLADPPLPTEIWRIPLDGGTPQLVFSLEVAPFFDAPVVFSPNAAFLAVVKELGLPTEMQRELSFVSADGATRLTYTAAAQLNFIAWASDSQHFFYTQGEEQAMYLGGLDETPQMLTSQPYGILEPRWVGDGRFVYIQQDGDTFYLCLGAIGAEARLMDSFSDFPAYDLYITHP